MKIFHIGICVYPEPIWISRALMKAGEYRECRPEDPDLINKVRQFNPDLIFIQVQSPVIPLEIVRELSTIGLVLNWMGDVRNQTEKWFYQWSTYVVNCFSNMRDVRAVPGAEYLQIGIDPLIFNRQDEEKKYDIVFLANRYNQFPLSGYRQRIIYRLKQTYHERFKVYGNGWPMADGNLNQSQPDECRLYNQAKIAISVSHFNIERYFSDRLIRAIGSGCFTLSHHYDSIDQDFKVGTHLSTFYNEGDLIEKINYYLTHSKEREQIARQGYDHVHENFTTDSMVKHIIEIYKRHELQLQSKV